MLSGCSPADGMNTAAPASEPSDSAAVGSGSSSPTSDASPTASSDRTPPTPAAAAPSAEATAPVAASTSVANGSASERRYARVNLGRFAADPAARGFTAYAVSRTEATLARDVTLPSLVRSTGPRYRAFLAGEYRTLRKNNWTTAAPTRWAVLALSRQSTAASLRACFWGPSTSYLDARTRKPVEDLDNRWYATRVQMSKQGVTWRVDDVQLSTFSCKGSTT
jgi:hypothetical protein